MSEGEDPGDERDAATRLRVVVAEDQPQVREALCDLIRSDEDLELVGAAADAEEALAVCSAERPDLLLLDVKMPGGGGARVARELRSGGATAGIVVLSAWGDERTRAELLSAGADAYLVKGAQNGEILGTLKRVAPSADGSLEGP